MSAIDDDIRFLLANTDDALNRWYKSIAPLPDDPQLILAGNNVPDPRTISEIFDQWAHRFRDELRGLFCHKLRYATLEQRQREQGEIALIALIASAILLAEIPVPVDPAATAVLLYSRRALDKICDQPAASPDVR